MFTEFCDALFASLKRRDQRQHAQRYLRGLLATEGRKTIRRIAAGSGPAVEQSLQQFISHSPWDWTPVRRSLAAYLEQHTRFAALVVEQVLISKAGEHSVGVERRFHQKMGRMISSQEVLGVWLATEHDAYPIEWQMVLSGNWLADDERRRRTGVPEDATVATTGELSVQAAIGVLRGWGLRARPVVMDARSLDLGGIMSEFSRHGIPFAIRVDGSIPLSPADSRVPFLTGRRVQAARLIHALRELSQPVSGGSPGHRPTLAVSTRVKLPSPAGRRPAGEPDLLLLGVTSGGDQAPEYWLTSSTHVTPATLFRLTRTLDGVREQRLGVSNKAGLRDFEGRSYRGWHHHVTLVSAAHAFRKLLSETIGEHPGFASVELLRKRA
ncbi:IS701 family transposase [Nonomuraea sp. NPDC002799]